MFHYILFNDCPFFVSCAFSRLQHSCLTADWLQSKNACSKDVYGETTQTLRPPVSSGGLLHIASPLRAMESPPPRLLCTWALQRRPAYIPAFVPLGRQGEGLLAILSPRTQYGPICLTSPALATPREGFFYFLPILL